MTYDQEDGALCVVRSCVVIKPKPRAGIKPPVAVRRGESSMSGIRKAILLTVVTISARPAAAQFGWRGDGTGRFDTKDPLTEWSESRNVIWKTKLPTEGKGAPAINGGRVFLHSFPHTLLCFGESDGEPLWKSDLGYKGIADDDQLARLEQNFSDVAEPA